MKSSDRAFSLMEIVVVIVIAGLLAAMLLPRLSGLAGQSVDQMDEANLVSLREAMEQWRMRENTPLPNRMTTLVVERDGQYRLPSVAELGAAAEDGRRWIPFEFMDRTKPFLHRLNASEAEDLHMLGLHEVVTLDGDVLAVEADTPVVMFGAGSKSGDNAAMDLSCLTGGYSTNLYKTAVSSYLDPVGDPDAFPDSVGAGIAYPDLILRLAMAVDKGCDLVAKRIIDQVPHSPYARVHGDPEFLLDQYIVALPRLQSTMVRGAAVADSNTAFKFMRGGSARTHHLLCLDRGASPGPGDLAVLSPRARRLDGMGPDYWRLAGVSVEAPVSPTPEGPPDPFTPTAGTGVFTDSGQSLGTNKSWGTTLLDVDGDGDLDAISANRENGKSQIWINDGSGQFSAGQVLNNNGIPEDAVAGDFDGDGDMDILVGKRGHGEGQELWINDGTGNYTRGASMGSGYPRTSQLSVADIDGDGDLDYVAANASTNAQVWVNDGNGNFSHTDLGGTSGSKSVAIGDVNGDGHADVIASSWGSSKVMLNDGSGNFSAASSLSSGNANSTQIGDIDGDGDLDMVVATGGYSQRDGSKVYVNDGSGNFTEAATLGGPRDSREVQMADLDNDGDLDLVEANWNSQANTIWINDGSGSYTASGSAGRGNTQALSIGDLNGDGALDVFTGNYNAGNEIHFNQP